MTTLKEWIDNLVSDGEGGLWAVYQIDVAGNGVFRDTAIGPMWVRVPPEVQLTEEEKTLVIQGYGKCCEWIWGPMKWQ